MKKTSIAAAITILGCMLMPSNLTYAKGTTIGVTVSKGGKANEY